MSQQYKAVAAILKNTIASINELLNDPQDELHKLSITNDLQRTHDKLLLLTGTGDLESGKSTVLGPAKTIGGVAISKQRRFTEADLVPSDDKVFKLKQDIDAALVYFNPNASAEGILTNMPDLIIRGVAKKAGLKVSKDEPKELTVEFIEEVKQALEDAGLTQRKEPAPALTKEELSDLEQRIKEATEGSQGEMVAPVASVNLNEVKEVVMETIPPIPVAEPETIDPSKQETKPDPKKKAGK
jgi:hypothetical protein